MHLYYINIALFIYPEKEKEFDLVVLKKGQLDFFLNLFIYSREKERVRAEGIEGEGERTPS